jgi:hypothetical protein
MEGDIGAGVVPAGRDDRTMKKSIMESVPPTR